MLDDLKDDGYWMTVLGTEYFFFPNFNKYLIISYNNLMKIVYGLDLPRWWQNGEGFFLLCG